jgi:hypothetical protein
LLGAVAVMGIEIDNRRAFGTIASLRMTDRNGCIVEKAKAHGSDDRPGGSRRTRFSPFQP